MKVMMRTLKDEEVTEERSWGADDGGGRKTAKEGD